jgi:transketolase
MTTGSLGQGFSSGVGIALANKIDGKKNWVYIILGDGECNEGEVWEAAMFANAHKLSNLIVFIDKTASTGRYDRRYIMRWAPAPQFEDYGIFRPRSTGTTSRHLGCGRQRPSIPVEGPRAIVHNTVKASNAYLPRRGV